MVRAVAAGHAAVGGVDDGITFQGGNVPLPEVQPRLQERQVSRIGDAFCGSFLLQVRILYLQKVCADTPWFTDIQQAPQKLSLAVCVCRYPQSLILRVFFQKHPNELIRRSLWFMVFACLSKPFYKTQQSTRSEDCCAVFSDQNS
ncbi:hypothetical protein [Faecalibacterium sp. OF04-11AC]|uniref:hypothetical protein n=1 Tax=Faecalibacterium sp. OF04-11AC TaxID=2293109 RepID=UPI00325BA4EA